MWTCFDLWWSVVPRKFSELLWFSIVYMSQVFFFFLKNIAQTGLKLTEILRQASWVLGLQMWNPTLNFILFFVP